jgi:NADPH:quinone reductase-like Zn-dependent oxidoreductase
MWKDGADYSLVRGILGCSVEMLKEVVKMVEVNDIHPVVDQVLEWGDAPKAYEALRSGGYVGKIVVKVT